MQTKLVYASDESNLDPNDTLIEFEGLGGHTTFVVDPKLLPGAAEQLDADQNNRLLPLFGQLVDLLYGGPTEFETCIYRIHRGNFVRFHVLPPGRAYWMHPVLWQDRILRTAIQDVMEGRAEKLPEDVLRYAREKKIRG